MTIYERMIIAAVLILLCAECLFLCVLYRQERKRADAMEHRLYKLENVKAGQAP